MHWTEISERTAGDVVVLELRGQLTLSDEDRRLMRRIRELLDQGRARVLLNLEHVSYIDSMGIGEIVGAFTRVKRQGGVMAISNVGPRVRELLEATSLDSVLQLYDDEEAALRAMVKGKR